LDTLTPDERRWRLKLADAKLREVSERLESSLKARYPDLFDRRGHLSTARLSRRLTEHTGGRKTLSEADLRALEESDAEAVRAGRAP
jgi:hypothetical protein